MTDPEFVQALENAVAGVRLFGVSTVASASKGTDMLFLLLREDGMSADRYTPRFRDLCPEADMRDAMTDGEFWEHVLIPEEHRNREYDPDDDPNIPDQAEYELEARLADPCPECGQVGACAYDAEGRALIHITEDDS